MTDLRESSLTRVVLHLVRVRLLLQQNSAYQTSFLISLYEYLLRATAQL